MSKNKYVVHLKDGKSITIEDDSDKLNDFINEVSVLMGSNRIGKISSSNSILIVKPMNILCVEILTEESLNVEETETPDITLKPEIVEIKESVNNVDEEIFEYNSFEDIDVETIGAEVDKILNNDDNYPQYEETEETDYNLIVAEQENIRESDPVIVETVNPIENLDLVSRVRQQIKESSNANSTAFQVDRSRLLPGEHIEDFNNLDGLDDLEAPQKNPTVEKTSKKKKKIKI